MGSVLFIADTTDRGICISLERARSLGKTPRQASGIRPGQSVETHRCHSSQKSTIFSVHFDAESVTWRTSARNIPILMYQRPTPSRCFPLSLPTSVYNRCDDPASFISATYPIFDFFGLSTVTCLRAPTRSILLYTLCTLILTTGSI